MASKSSFRRKRARKISRSDVMLSHPPMITGTQLSHSGRMRFITNAPLAKKDITFGNLLDTYLLATTATVGYDVFQAVRVKSVELWALPIVGGATTVSVEFSGVSAGLVGDQMIHSDTSMGISPAHVLARPSPRSLAADYQISGGANAFVLTCPTGTVIDVSLTFNGQLGAQGSAVTMVAATAGVFYLRGLDGLATATSQIPPDLSQYQD